MKIGDIYYCIMCKHDSTRLKGHICSSVLYKEGNVLFNDALNTFYLQLYKDYLMSYYSSVFRTTCVIRTIIKIRRKEMFYLSMHILFIAIWCQTYGKGPLR